MTTRRDRLSEIELKDIEGDLPLLSGAKDRPTLREVIHLVPGDIAAGGLKVLGAKHVFRSFDALDLGPSSLDPKTHVVQRRKYWRDFYRQIPRPPSAKAIRHSEPKRSLLSATDVGRALESRQTKQPVLVWKSHSWREELFLWWACDALIQTGVSSRDIWIASPRVDGSTGNEGPLRSLASAKPDELRHMFMHAHRTSSAQLRLFARRWTAFARGDLGALQKLTPEGLPPASTALVPQMDSQGERKRLYLAPADRHLLGLFSSGEWSKIRDHLRTAAWFSLIQEFGDLFVPMRLTTWAMHAPDVLEMRPLADSKSYLNCVEYRLTPKGIAMLTEGLSMPTDAPPIAMGGFVAYAPDMKWACEASPHGWRYTRIQPARSSHRKGR